ncbi:MAG TPA: hypothetical protein DDX92_04685 [Flavobacteriales bacterium]|jgi:type IX secretion system PorP/SprF family membrane protein|nr:hypothetical protein [Flavobacteriales bacterium]
MKKALLIFASLVTGVISIAQQDPQFTVSQFQNLVYQNPAMAGSNDAICGMLVGRQQWVGFGEEPRTFLFSTDAAFKDPWLGKQHGAGLTVLSDGLGQENTFIAKLAYAYRMKAGAGMLSAGVGLGYISKTIGSDWNPGDPGWDPSIPYNGITDGGFDFDFGLFYKIPKKLYVGLSATHLTATQLEKDFNIDLPGPGGNPITQEGVFNYRIDRTIYFTAGYQTQVFNPDWQIKPAVLIKSNIVSTSIDLAAVMEYREKFWGGLDYRFNDAIALMLGANFQMKGQNFGGGLLKVGYSYDYTLSEINQYSSGSHEIFVHYCFRLTPKIIREKHRTVRFL